MTNDDAPSVEPRVGAPTGGRSVIGFALAALILIIGAAVNALFWVSARSIHERDLDLTRRAAVIETSRFAAAVEDRSSEVLRALDRSMTLLRDEWHNDRGSFMIHAERVVMTVHSDLVFQIGVTDANGVIIRTDRDQTPPAIDVADRDFFREQRWSGSDRLVIGRRMEGYIAGGRSIIISTSLGEGEGAILLWIDPISLMRPPHGLEPAADMTTLLVGTDGRTRACLGDLTGDPCLDHFENESFLSAHPDTNGPVWLAPRADGEGARVGTYRSLARYPLFALAIRSEAAIDQAPADRWRKTLSRLRLVTIGLTAVFGGLAIFAARLIARHERVRRAEERWRSALTASGDLVWDWSVDSGAVEIRTGTSRLLDGRIDGGIDGITRLVDWRNLLHADDIPRIESVIHERLGSESNSFSCEVRLRRGDDGTDWAMCDGIVLAWGRDGRAARIVGTLSDISDRKALEVALVREREEVARINARFAEITSSDPLTGFGNLRRLTDAADRVSTGGGPRTAALILMNIDHFKRVNEANGRAAGDAALRLIARRLARRAAATDTVCRLSGEEFAILVVGRDLDAATALAEECRSAVSTPPLPLPGDGLAVLTASFGVTSVDPDQEFARALRRAHAALRLAKAAGGDTVRALAPGGEADA